ncbi:hypothetical protein QR680_011509 [Steinernema hermaphroditum]|uniref:Peptidase S1 domain-containing protein n=1 Tax=Steinernema hermaphroditum TaxID=289476 RepID=A0AA39HYQ5_9BILA|nr:hypothetical protein QR680_011509 [Steinernema hermaphroditum]
MRVLLLFIALVGLSLALPESELIVGGSQAFKGAFPYYARIPRCGGSLITPKHVLTAAHCIFNDTVGQEVLMGLVDKENYKNDPDVQIRKIISVKAHTGFQKRNWRDDIAILEVDQPFDITDSVQLANIEADDSQLRKSTRAVACGFGRTDYVNKKSVYPRYLQYVFYPLIDNAKCKKFWSWKLWEKQICAGAKNKGISNGDSGGPLAVNYGGKKYQIGVVSYTQDGFIRDQSKYPGVYTRTASYCDWMTEKTDGEFKCLSA